MLRVFFHLLIIVGFVVLVGSIIASFWGVANTNAAGAVGGLIYFGGIAGRYFTNPKSEPRS